MVLFGIAYQRTVIRAILPRSWHVQLIATLATSIMLTNLAIIVFGTQPKEVPTRAVLARARRGRRPHGLAAAAGAGGAAC